jgi:hypothetical protein
MPTPADDIEIQIRKLIDRQIRVFGQSTSLTPFDEVVGLDDPE